MATINGIPVFTGRVIGTNDKIGTFVLIEECNLLRYDTAIIPASPEYEKGAKVYIEIIKFKFSGNLERGHIARVISGEPNGPGDPVIPIIDRPVKERGGKAAYGYRGWK